MPLGIVLNLAPVFPATGSEAARTQARIDDGTSVRWYCHPLFHGCYPSDIVAHYGADAPVVQADDMQTIAQPLDLLGANNHSRHVACCTMPIACDTWPSTPPPWLTHASRAHASMATCSGV